LNVKTKAITIITRKTGTIPKSLRKHLSNMPGKHEIKGLQKKPYWAGTDGTWEGTDVKVRKN